MTTLGIALNTRLLAPSQYAGLNFNSACVFNGAILLAGDTGIYTHDGSTDNGTVISAYFHLPSGSKDTSIAKRFRKLVISGYFGGVLTVTMLTEENDCTSVSTKSYDTDNRTIEVPLNYTDHGTLVGFKIENNSGSDFSFELITALIQYLVLKSKTTLTIGRFKNDTPDITVSASGS
jgi:hypothetical protein